LEKKAFIYPALVMCVLILGIGIRILKFPEIPPGLHIDEASSAYEAFSLLETGKDKWGHPLPAYFPGWGSGQNVLQAYLTIPFLKLFGLGILSARLPALILGILSLPLFFYCLRPVGRFPALLGLLLISLVPWHFMLSRWALESNLAPFCMLLGATALTRALLTRGKRWIVPALIPFAGALYAYGTTILVLPALFGLVWWFYYKQIRLQWPAWLLALTLFSILAFPFFIFFVENYLLHANLSWTDGFFFSTPLLPSNRLHQISSGSWLDTLYVNYRFLKTGFADNTNYNLMPGYRLLLSLTLPVTIAGLITGIFQMLGRKDQWHLKPGNTVIAVFLFWAMASGVLAFCFRLNINRFNHFYLPALAISVWLINTGIKSLNHPLLKRTLQLGVVGWMVVESSAGILHYFTYYPQTEIRTGFQAGLEEAFEAVHQLPVSQVRLPTDNMPLPLTYNYALFYLHYPPAAFQEKGDFKIEGGVYKVNRFGKYLFYDAYLDRRKAYGYLTRKGGFKSDARLRREICYENEFWEVGIIRPPAVIRR
jgi:4-amino-4-deoxy-L-arabinose transferase-like glycosyltransferase